MNYISILIVDDDLNKITNIISTIKEIFSETLSVSQASCVQEAIENLQKKEFHLLITDLQMPLKYDDEPNKDGGNSLISNIYKSKNKVNVPMYIVGLTQFNELTSNLKGVWKVWHYDSSLEEWKNNLRDLIFHISLIKPRIISDKIETIFVEGPTDKSVLESTLKFFFPTLADKVYIDTVQYGGGASWVERQIFIWSKTLALKQNKDNYIKSVGLLDDDNAGNSVINRIRTLTHNDSAEIKTFSLLKTSYKYSPLLKSIKTKGISFSTTIEDLISIDCLRIAQKNGWLVLRDSKDVIIDNTKLNISMENYNYEGLKLKNFNDDEILICLHKVGYNYKKQFCNLFVNFEKKEVEPLKHLVSDILIKLKLI